MGVLGITSNSSAMNNSIANCNETQVVLNVYDLTPANNYSYWFGFGIYHSGIEVHGKEFGFGAHEFPLSGVFEVEPKSCPGFIYRCSITLGSINMGPAELGEFIENAAPEYHGDTYNLISKNCNHFTDDISFRLTGKHIPGWVNRLARLGGVCSCLLPESLQVTTVKHVPEYYECTENEDGCESGCSDLTGIDDTDEEEQLLSPPSLGELCFVKEIHK